MLIKKLLHGVAGVVVCAAIALFIGATMDARMEYDTNVPFDDIVVDHPVSRTVKLLPNHRFLPQDHRRYVI